MKSKAKIEKQLVKKKNPELIETIILAKKNNGWMQVASILSGSRKHYSAVNLDRVEKESREGDTLVIPGKVLSQGGVSKKIRVVALDFSSQAREKLKEKGCEIVKMAEEIKLNPKAQGIKIIR